jgi:hypothetical protein
VFPLAVLLVFLVLAALYESWTLPMAVILIVPMCMLSALLGVWLMGWRQQHLRPGRPGGADGAGLQERDPDRGVRRELERQGWASWRRRSKPAGCACARSS